MYRFVRAVVVLAVLLAPVGAFAQDSATIAGTVRDASGGVLPGVTVEASSSALIEKVRSVTTMTLDSTASLRCLQAPTP
jgi:hypothetical protein